MKIETLDDLAAINCGGCCGIEIEAHLPPNLVGEVISETQTPCFYTQHTANGGAGKFRRKVGSYNAYQYTSGGGIFKSWDVGTIDDERWDGDSCEHTHEITGGVIGSPPLTGLRREVIDTEAGVPPQNYSRTQTENYYRFPGTPSEYLYYQTVDLDSFEDGYVDFVTELTNELRPVIDTLVFPDDATAGSPIASSSIDLSGPVTLALTKARYRWEVPANYPFKYLKVTWDILEEPDGWDDPSPTVNRSFYAEDLTWEWVDGDDEESPWQEIPFPEVAGERRIVNVRYEVYRSAKLGSLPIAVGEAVGDDEL